MVDKHSLPMYACGTKVRTMKKWFLVFWPYLICVVVGTVLFIAGSTLSDDGKNLVVGIAGAFFAIPLLYAIYESAQKFSNRRLNRELFDYAKMRIDREILSMVNQLMKIVHPYDERDASLKGITTFLSLNIDQTADAIANNEYIGFQVLKDWSVSEDSVVQILESPFILQRLNNDQVIAIIAIMKQIRALEAIQKNISDLYVPIGKEVTGYKVQAGIEMNESNSKYPNRYLLLKHLRDDIYQVADFGDFPLYQVSKLLYLFRVNEKYKQVYAQEIFNTIKAFNIWIELTGTELLLDTKMFRLGVQDVYNKAELK